MGKERVANRRRSRCRVLVPSHRRHRRIIIAAGRGHSNQRSVQHTHSGVIKNRHPVYLPGVCVCPVYECAATAAVAVDVGPVDDKFFGGHKFMTPVDRPVQAKPILQSLH